MLTLGTRVPASEPRRFGNAGRPPPPWLSFSGRWPCVTTPCQSTRPANGSTPLTVGSVVNQTGSTTPIPSSHGAGVVSYVADTLSVSPLRTEPRQSGFVNVIEASHETAPAGS